MKIIKCSNGHFYDVEKNTKCPECDKIEMYESTITEMLLDETSETSEVPIGDTLKHFLELEENDSAM